eukprot:NODE_1194_length_1651_cov_31.742821_g1060_i0.p1 GENE.NODE_1194_length_1651_cov_31.742821_g1060_i0~~NODE_1194_length_1651_cov_31.742821_g1060_i0.p1  ORF type:complete len:195 (+),score=27.17 NODE_1194_length_1651_cov_31.742821_g1060_i0:397-981(+)
MYDYVDLGESDLQAQEVRKVMIEQNLNPFFTPAGGAQLIGTADRVSYSIDDLFHLAQSPMVLDAVPLPCGLAWLDKRVDLEDDFEEYDSTCSPSPYRSPARTPIRAVLSEQKARMYRTPLAMRPINTEPRGYGRRVSTSLSPEMSTPKLQYENEGNKENDPYSMNMTLCTPPPSQHPIMFCSLPYSSPYSYAVY